MENQNFEKHQNSLKEPIFEEQKILVLEEDEEESNNTLRVHNKKNIKEGSLSNATKSQIARLSTIRKKNLLKRIFRKIKKGSLRYVVLLWIRMTVGVGILTLPKLS